MQAVTAPVSGGSSSGGTALFTSVTPSATGTPNSEVAFGNYAYVSVQGTGQIFSYNISSGNPVAAATYATPCDDPSGMVTATIGGVNVMAVICFDTGSLLTLTMQGNGTLTALGSVGGLPVPFPGIAIDGTDVYVPLYGVSLQTNGAVARVSLAQPASPVVTATATLLSPASGGTSNPGYLTVDSGYVYVAAGSESQPRATTSTVQVLSESTMAMVGTPLPVDHSPQEIAIHNGVAFVTIFDAGELQSIDVSNPASLQLLQTLPLAYQGVGCEALPIAVFELYAYIGCYGQAEVLRYNIGDPTNMVPSTAITGLQMPERMFFLTAQRYLFVTGSQAGGAFYQIDAGRF